MSIEGSPASDASQPGRRDAGHEEQTADAGQDVGDAVQAVVGDRRAEGQPEQTSGEDGSHVAEGLELATRGAHVMGWNLLVESSLQAEAVESVGDAEDDTDSQDHDDRGGDVADQQQEGTHGEHASANDEGRL